jgi:carbamoyl-phosphate synthase large subunit
VSQKDRQGAIIVAKRLLECGFSLVCTDGTAARLNENGLYCEITGKVHEGDNENVIHLIKKHEIAMVINTADDKDALKDSHPIRLAALNHHVPYFTTLAGANAFSLGLIARHRGDGYRVISLQEYHNRPDGICEGTLPE